MKKEQIIGIAKWSLKIGAVVLALFIGWKALLPVGLWFLADIVSKVAGEVS